MKMDRHGSKTTHFSSLMHGDDVLETKAVGKSVGLVTAVMPMTASNAFPLVRMLHFHILYHVLYKGNFCFLYLEFANWLGCITEK